ncbi:metal-dependent protease, putative molecular chaperone [Campylobacter fetus]|uniref:metal-dependent protease, putative molecular chaperone n=1 Tax=Campylobacter fetus TaxID=196 RepID=UPI0003C291BE|nr:metal-dependent protease, putative molecular chaperone [Campylobacter fetus]AGZ82300.1 N6-L-threonylcarbamoyladenine synthase, TsaB subunit [Campylobacter fetus subsp. testudinum 03-427]EAI4322061.1 glycoprotease [Campylobacter fetus]EAI4391695.1 glycoprotease [Campylobacter fetus]MPB72640.1 glycoprotease [Campylobacter fetus]MPB77950.1 glycoprotease [Campylobacter fetus]
MALSSPLLIGIYENDNLIKELSSDQKASESLIAFLDEISLEFIISSITYANTPGSFMGLKVSYVILKTFCIAKNIDFWAVSGFELNGFGAIRANKNLSFVYSKDGVSLQKVEQTDFKLPNNLSNLNKKCDTLPEYIIDAI